MALKSIQNKNIHQEPFFSHGIINCTDQSRSMYLDSVENFK